jgi:hypothetical protein
LAGSYIKSLQLAKQLEQKAKEASKKKGDAETQLQAAEAILAHCKSVNADVGAVEKAIAEVVAALDGKDYDLALEKAEKAAGAAKNVFVERVHSILATADEIVTIITEVGEEPAPLKQLMADTKAALKKDDFDGAIKLAEETYDSSQKALHEQYAKAYSMAQQITLKTKEFGENVDDLQKDLQSTKQMIESEDYTTAITSVKTVMEAAADILRTRIVSDIDSIEDSVLSAEDLGADTVKLKEYISKARELLEAKEFDEAMSYARRAQSECEKSVSGRVHEETRRLREDARTTKKHGGEVDSILSLVDASAKLIKDSEVAEASRNLDKARTLLKETQFKLVLASISRSKDSFVLARKLGVDITGVINLLNASREKLQKGSFEEAINAAEEAEKEIENSLGAFRHAQEGVENLSNRIKALEDIGIRIPDDMTLFQEARGALSERDFVLAAEKASAGIEALDRRLKDIAQEKVLDAENILQIAIQLKADVSDAKDLLKSANDHLAELEAAEAYKAAQESIGISSAACRDFIIDTISSLETFLDECTKTFDVTEYKADLQSAKDLAEASKFVDAMELITGIKTGVEKRGAEECRRLIGDAEVKLGELEAAGIDAADLHLMISKADQSVSEGHLENAAATAKEAIHDADAILEDISNKTLLALKSALEDAKQESMDTTKWRGLYKQSKDMLDTGNYSSSYQTSKRILDEINKLSKERQVVLSKMKKCEELLADASKNRLDVTAPMKLLDEARNAMSSLEIDRVSSMVADAEKSIESTMGMYLAAKMILVLKSSLEFAEREKVDAGDMSRALDESKAAMKERKYDAALVAAKRGQAIIAEAFKERVTGEIGEIRALIADAKNVGVDASRSEKLLEQAQAEYEQTDFEMSLKSALLAKDEIDQIRELSSKSAMEIRIAKERIRDAEAIGLDMAELRPLLEQAIDALNSHKYAISFEFARKTSTQTLDVIKKDLDRLFDKLVKRVEAAEKDGAEFETADSLLTEAKKAYGTMEFQEAIGFIMRCEQELDRVDLQYSIAGNSLAVAKKRLEDAEKDMLVVSRAERIYSSAESAMKGKKFAEVVELSISLGDEIERVRRQIDGCRLDLNSLDDRIARLNRIGLEIQDINVMKQTADKAFQAAEFDTSRKTCAEAERAISINLERIITEKLRQAEGLLDSSRHFGLPEKESRDLLDVAKTSAKEGLWDFAYEQTQKAIVKIEQMLKEKIHEAIDAVRAKMSAVAKSGAATKLVDEELKSVELKIGDGQFDDAFRTVQEAENLLSRIEALHREYLDAKYAAESAIKVAKKFGLPTKESDRMVATAEIERDKDYPSAIGMLGKAAELTRASLDKFSPEIAIVIKPVGLKCEQRGMILFDVTNKGKALAKDLKMEFQGRNIEVESVPEIPGLKAGETRSVSIPVIPKQSGEIEIAITIAAKRVFDGRSFEFTAKTPIKVIQKEPTARAAVATEPTTCSSCNGKVKPGFDIAICRKCNSAEHLACAKRTKKCGSCGAALEF